jgi:hypothetical protein
MRRITALTTAITFSTIFGGLPASSATAADTAAEVLVESHFSDQGFEIDLFVTRGTDGTILSEATVRDPSNADEIDVWTDGITVWWDGVVNNQHTQGIRDGRGFCGGLRRGAGVFLSASGRGNRLRGCSAALVRRLRIWL